MLQEELIEKYSDNVRAYTVNKEQSKINQWIARIDEITPSPLGFDTFDEVKVLLEPIGGWQEKYPSVTSPTLKALFYKSNKDLYEKAKKLSPGETVATSGMFDDTDFRFRSDEMDYPKISINLKDITKIENP